MNFHNLESSLIEKAGDRFYGLMLDILRGAQKFYIGDIDLLPKLPDQQDISFSRAPYPICAFEMFTAWDDKHSRIVVICFDTTERIEFEVFATMPKEWMCIAHIALDRQDGQITNRFTHDAVDIAKQIEGGALREEALLSFARGVLRSLEKFLRVLNCSNVATEIVEPSKPLNAKRARTGKPLICSYHILVLKKNQKRSLHCPAVGDYKNSPRIHLRRGHIKRRKTGTFWWDPHVVGDRTRGIVVKDYDASQIAAQS